MALQPSNLRNALASIIDHDSGKDIVTAGMVKDVQADGDNISLEIELSSPESPLQERLREQIESAIRATSLECKEVVGSIQISFTADTRSANERIREETNPLPGVKKIIAVGAGKGGVGKSTVSTILAVGLSRQGAKVGLLDGDIYGPSMTTMLGLQREETIAQDNFLLPFEVHGIKAMTIGKLVEPDKALIWRGPRAHSAFSQLALQTKWGELDYLIIDLPPGTGDVPLSLAQLLPLSGSVIVCTPQVVAQDDARRAVRMFQELGIPILGLVENMSYFVADDGKEYDIFGRGGGEQMAAAMNVDFLGGIPIHPDMRVSADTGEPLKNWKINDTMSKAFDNMCSNFISSAESTTLDPPTLSIS
ncbi:MAG: Mrp/NBP35 family ATP-binding protein [Phycisphaerales bacterium]|nr:Mrp/NBP35 family ATP-binding protein [Planctomycetota bacterium]MBL6998006.1 Mrp/NBP35 family ATP-binding protein [Phycisphaerales bacterium]